MNTNTNTTTATIAGVPATDAERYAARQATRRARATYTGRDTVARKYDAYFAGLNGR